MHGFIGDGWLRDFGRERFFFENWKPKPRAASNRPKRKATLAKDEERHA